MGNELNYVADIEFRKPLLLVQTLIHESLSRSSSTAKTSQRDFDENLNLYFLQERSPILLSSANINAALDIVRIFKESRVENYLGNLGKK